MRPQTDESVVEEAGAGIDLHASWWGMVVDAWRQEPKKHRLEEHC